MTQSMLSHSHNYAGQSIAVIGYGVSGKACAQYLSQKGAKVSVFDKSFDVSSAKNEHFECGILNDSTSLLAFDLLVVSPGVNLKQSFIQAYLKKHKHKDRIIGDIELFARELNAQNENLAEGSQPTKLIAVTGSNGKSTVVDMLFKGLRTLGLNVLLGGNFGTPALALISESSSHRAGENIDLIILELSSFQLESTFSLCPDIACILNISSDHLDRHGNMDAYIQAKQQIYVNAKHVVYNREDPACFPLEPKAATSFGLTCEQDKAEASFYQNDAGIFNGKALLFDLSKYGQFSQFQVLNMQVVMVCAHILKDDFACIDLAAIAQSLSQYKGLAHRFELIRQSATTRWINDSKATNPGASIAAIESLSKQVQHIILIAGGDAKGAQTSDLGKLIAERVDRLVLIGKDADLFTHFDTPFTKAKSIEEAVAHASNYADELVTASINAQECVDSKCVGILLSPACASIDMFSNYQQRGELFCQAVNAEVAA